MNARRCAAIHVFAGWRPQSSAEGQAALRAAASRTIQQGQQFTQASPPLKGSTEMKSSIPDSVAAKMFAVLSCLEAL
jgi:hypothetical protein